MPQKETVPAGNRPATINAVNTYLKFFVLIVLAVEAVLGTLAFKSEGPVQLIAIYGMIFVITTLIAIVTFFAYFKPGALLGSTPASAPQNAAQSAFARKLAGFWWETIQPDNPIAVSFLEIRADDAGGSVMLKGQAYSRDGARAEWNSVASCLNQSEARLFYYWKGWHRHKPGEAYGGFGEIAFHELGQDIASGVGFYSDSNMANLQDSTLKSISLRRCTNKETQMMRGTDDAAIAALVATKLGKS